MLSNRYHSTAKRLVQLSLVAATILTFGLWAPASAQETSGQIRGTILDPQGAVCRAPA